MKYLLSKLATSGTNGQFRTPRHIIDMMVKLVKPLPTDSNSLILRVEHQDFLVGAGEYLRKNHDEIFNSPELKSIFRMTCFMEMIWIRLCLE